MYRLRLFALGLSLSACLSEKQIAGSAGSFVTDIRIERDNNADGLLIAHCSINSSVTETSGLVPLLVTNKWSQKSDRDVTISGCGVDFKALPSTLFPPDALDAPSWCRRSLARWRTARHSDRLAELERRRALCNQIRADIQRRADVLRVEDRGKLYLDMPECGELRLPLDAPPTAPQVEAWHAVGAGCRPYAEVEKGVSP